MGSWRRPSIAAPDGSSRPVTPGVSPTAPSWCGATRLAALERQEVEWVRQETARARGGRTFLTVKPGARVGGTLVGSANLASGRYAMGDALLKSRRANKEPSRQ